MERKVLLDTNVIQALLDLDDKLHNRAREELLALPLGTKFIIPYVVLAEVVINAPMVEKVYELCRTLTDQFEYNILDDIDFISQLNLNKRKSLKANDCLILSVCRREGAKLLTFDERLSRFADKII